MKSAHLIVVGKLKDKNLELIEQDYLKRIKNPNLKIHEVKASAENKNQEAESVLKKADSISSNYNLIILTEFGNEYDSPQFSKWLFEQLYQNREPIFVLCGAQGPGDKLIEKSQSKISLSKLTYPHKLARIIFVEQFYRAITIKEGHPYHN